MIVEKKNADIYAGIIIIIQQFGYFCLLRSYRRHSMLAYT